MSTTGGPATSRKVSAGSGQGVAWLSGACTPPDTGTEPVAIVPALQVEVAKPAVASLPSSSLTCASSVGAAPFVKLMKLTYTCAVVGGASPGASSSTATQLRSSTAPGVVPQACGPGTKLSP